MGALPELLAEIAGVVGLPAALALADAKGGRRIVLPHTLPSDHWLIAVVGRKSAEALCRHFAVTDADGRSIPARLAVPLGPTSMRARARQVAAAALERGASISEASRLSGLHVRSVFRLKANPKTYRAGVEEGSALARLPTRHDLPQHEPGPVQPAHQPGEEAN